MNSHRLLLLLLAVLGLPCGHLPAATYTVTSTADSGAGSLRQALLDAMATPGVADTIAFNLPGLGVRSIAVLSPLPTITESLTIDGTTQPAYTLAPLIELNGQSAGTGTHGLRISRGEPFIRALIINRFSGDGIRIDTGLTADAAGATITGCWIGTNSAGTAAAANAGNGIHISSGPGPADNPADVVIGGDDAVLRNVISGNGGDGVHITSRLPDSVLVRNNHIGLDRHGGGAVGNGGDGIDCRRSYADIEIDYIWYPDYWVEIRKGVHLDGPNWIAGNGRNGIAVSGTWDGQRRARIGGNHIGMNRAGTAAVPNGQHGILAQQAAAIGWNGAGNFVAGNTGSGIRIEGGGSMVIANSIGLTSSGNLLGNGEHGLHLHNAVNCQVGAPPDHAGPDTAALRNVIVANTGSGIQVGGTSRGHAIAANLIGILASGAPAGNGGHGISLGALDLNPGTLAQNGGIVGGGNAVTANHIAHNGGCGIAVLPISVGNALLWNSIRGNALQGIDLGADGLTANDAGDGDTGANHLQNHPVIKLASPSRIAGSLTSIPLRSFRVHLYRTDAAHAGSGNGRWPLTTTDVTTDASGFAAFDVPFGGLNIGERVTATATIRPRSGVVPWEEQLAQTSEFAPDFTVTGEPGTLSFTAAAVQDTEGETVVLTVQRTGGSAGHVSASWTVTGGTAAGGADFPPAGGVLDFAPGQVQRTIAIPLLDDARHEPAEGFTVTIGSLTGGALPGAVTAATVTITDNDSPPTVSIAGAEAVEGTGSPSTLVLTISLSEASGYPVSVNYATLDGSAVAGGDYTSAAGTVQFAPGEVGRTLSLVLQPDAVAEPGETFHVQLSAPVNAALGSAQAAVVILDDDSPGIIQFASAGHHVPENWEGKSLTLTRSGGTAGTVTVQWSITGGTATAGEDYSPFSQSGTVTFAPGQSSRLVHVWLLDDVLLEGSETLTVSLAQPGGGAVLGERTSAVLTILDDDAAPMIQGRVLKAGGAALANASVTLSGTHQASVTTDHAGYYTFTGLAVGGSYAVTAAAEGWDFQPATRTWASLQNSEIEQDFTASPAAVPELHLSLAADGGATLYWPASAAGWTLQSSATLAPGSWAAVPGTPVLTPEWHLVTLPGGPQRRFFRLVKP